ncbi:hypothetical protein BDZ97DRAFT_2072845 [Flammula alnicola]|nr:hypothetical protein BDZ97DRAFT_2072821 [Flammula alnicola]KAF8968864.1 hypothetical protein BDZ97DRAFT_2072845 [Flammula alnicola]
MAKKSESPFSQFLDTNDVPSDTEVVQIKEYILACTAKLSKLDHSLNSFMADDDEYPIVIYDPRDSGFSGLAQLQTADDLRSQRDLLSEHISAHRSCLSPVRRVPQEIWEQIFVRCLPEGRNPVIGAHEMPMGLCHVCRSWRFIALTTRILWSRVHVVIHSAPSQNRTGRIRSEVLEQWLTRAAPLPLSISVSTEAGENGSYSEITCILATLTKFSKYWENFQLETLFQVPAASLVTGLTGKDVPLLRDISFLSSQKPQTRHTLFGGNVWVPNDLPILQAPRLQSLRFVYASLPFKIAVNWTQLTELRLEGCYLTGFSCYVMLSACKNLQHATLDTCDRHAMMALPNLSSPFDSVRLVYLESLVLFEKTFLPILFDVPKLRSFTYRGFLIPPRTSLIQHLLRSAEKLDSLFIDPGGIELHQLLPLTPTVKHLTLAKPITSYPPLHQIFAYAQGRGMDDALLERLTPRIRQGPDAGGPLVANRRDYMCPELQTLTYKTNARCSFSAGALINFMKARMDARDQHGFTKLEEVVVHSNQRMDGMNGVGVDKAIEELRQQGMTIGISYNRSAITSNSIAWLLRH